jgi:hypothetical protein
LATLPDSPIENVMRSLLLLGILCLGTDAAKVLKPSLLAQKKEEHPLIRPVCGALAACTAEAMTMPIDMTKVRMQIAKDTSLSFAGTMAEITSTEGVGALFKGLKPALLRQASYQGLKMYLYEPIRDAVLKATTPEGEEGGEPKLWQMILAGGLAGGIGTLLTSPTDLIKIRMQSGVQYGGVIDALTSIAASTGMLSLWDGWAPNVQRSFIVNAAELATYDYFKQMLLKYKFFRDAPVLLVHTLASSGAGLVAAIASTPVDRAKTLLMTNKGVYSSVFACLVKIYRENGLAGLYQGFLATWMRLGPWAFLFFVVFEQLRGAALRLTADDKAK